MAAAVLSSEPLNLMGSRIEVKCVDNITRTGFLYTKDPVTGVLVIVNRIMPCDKVDLDNTGSSTIYNRLGPKTTLECENREKCEGMDSKNCSIRLEIIMGDAYTSIEQIHRSNDLDDWAFLERTIMQRLEERSQVVAAQFCSKDLESRMNTVAKFLSSHHLPLTIDNGVIVLFGGLAKIESPYISESCVCRNPVVLDKVHKLLEQCSFTEASKTSENE